MDMSAILQAIRESSRINDIVIVCVHDLDSALMECRDIVVADEVHIDVERIDGCTADVWAYRDGAPEWRLRVSA
jgi:ABC-type cobalamin/Fe3+-siderophores transport system ATPase subunit